MIAHDNTFHNTTEERMGHVDEEEGLTSSRGYIKERNKGRKRNISEKGMRGES